MAVKKQNNKQKANKKKPSGWMDSNDCRWQKKFRYFQEQCFLFELWSEGKFKNYKTEMSTISQTFKVGVREPLEETVTLEIDKKKLHGYDNFTILETTQHKDILSLLAENKALDVHTFSKFKPHHLSALIPKLKLYKVYFASKSSKNPMISIPFYFPSHAQTGDTPDLLQKALLSGAPLANVGIKNFSWELQGLNPATIDYSVVAKLGIFLQQLNDLEIPLPVDSATESLIDDLEGTGIEAPSYKDLLLPPKNRNVKTTTLTPGGNQEHVPDHFKIKAEIGWQLPPNADKFFTGLTKEEVEDFKRAVRNSSRTLILNTIDHDLNFNQDGTLEVSISYQASFEASLQSPDAELLIDAELRREIDKFNAFEAETLKKVKDIRRNSGAPKERRRRESEKIFKNFQNLEKKFKDYVKGKRSFLYKNLIKEVEDRGRIFHTLYDTKAIAAVWQNEGGVQQQVYSKYAAIKRNQYIKNLKKTWPDHLLEKVLKEGKTFFDLNADQIATKDGKPAGVIASQQITTQINKLNELLKKAKSAAEKKKINKQIKSLTSVQVKTNTKLSGIRWTKSYKLDNKGKRVATKGRPYYELTFFFLGDLIEAAIEIAVKNSPDDTKFFKNTDFLFGPVQYYDPRLNKGTGGYTTISLADIPISYSLFREWFNANIAQKDLRTYKLYQFFKDIFSNFLRDALGGKCYDALSYDSNPTLVGIHNFNTKIPAKKSRSDIFADFSGPNSKWISDNADRGRVPLTNQLIDAFAANRALTGLSKTRNWIVFYVASNRTGVREGSISQDVADGIPHFYIGADSGILKTMNFTKENWKYFKEQRILQKTGYERLGQPYSVQLKIFGNNFFRPGQFIYINPRRPGVTSKIGKELLLEGYYLIIKVGSQISNGVYETNITAKYESTGLSPQKRAFNLRDNVPEPVARKKKKNKPKSTNQKKKSNKSKNNKLTSKKKK